jgi:hypothetical protein
LPPNLQFVDGTFQCSNLGSVVGNTVTCNFGDVPADHGFVAAITVCAIAPGTVTNTATVSSGTPDPTPTNNTDTETTTITPGDPSTCPSPPPTPLPTPTTKQQCKKGGFEEFGFRNEGDCTSFVATGGKNEPGKNQKK